MCLQLQLTNQSILSCHRRKNSRSCTLPVSSLITDYPFWSHHLIFPGTFDYHDRRPSGLIPIDHFLLFVVCEKSFMILHPCTSVTTSLARRKMLLLPFIEWAEYKCRQNQKTAFEKTSVTLEAFPACSTGI